MAPTNNLDDASIRSRYSWWVIPASEKCLRRHVRVLTNLGSRHGLSNFRLAGEGQIIADIAAGRTYLDVAAFELDAEGVLRAGVSVILSETELAARSDQGPLNADRAA